MADSDDDIVDSVLSRLQMALGADVLSDAFRDELEVSIRHDWQGQVYVQTKPILKRQQILKDWRGGLDVAALSVKYSITERRVRQIINARRRHG